MWWHVRHTVPTEALIPGTTDVVRSHSHEELWIVWLRECDARGIDLPNPKAIFQDCCCRALPPDKMAKCCAFVDESSPALLRQARVIGIEDIRDFFRKVRSWKKTDAVVSQEEADRRAGICTMCEQNRPASLWGCPGCTGVLTEIADNLLDLTGGRTTSSDRTLEHCGVCACSLKIIVHAPLEVLHEHRNPEHVFPSHCWQTATVQSP